jgi:acyl-coenzyme A thioesterase PaaI-like protein
MKKKSKAQRQKELVKILEGDPFYTDEELSSVFNVSIQTIRLDRMSLNIPELRERLKTIAETQGSKVKTLGKQEIIGEIIELSVGQLGISMLEITDDMIYTKTNTVRDAYVFSLTSSLAMAIVNAPKVILRSANINCITMIENKDRLIAKAEVHKKEDRKHFVKVVVNSRNHDQVFKGDFIFEEID